MSGNNFQHVLDKKPDKVDLLNLLVSYDDLWAEIGEGLKVDGRHIRGLRQTSGMSNKIKLSTILQSWMDTLCSEVTWDNVKQALEGPVVDAKAIAVKIKGGQTKPDKPELLEVLAPIASKWSEIGSALNVRPDVIEGLNSTPSNVTKLSTILQKWLDTLSSPITWRNVIEMLESKFTDNGNAADQVRDFLKSNEGYEKYINRPDPVPVRVRPSSPLQKRMSGNNIQLILDKKPKKTDLLNQLAGVAAKWQEIGEGLCVNDGDIESLKQSNQRDVNKLSSVLQKWMDTMCSDVTWKNILAVLESPLVDKKSVAGDVRKFLKRDDIFEKYQNS